ncbi:MAG: polyphenol oxidase family protein [Candidatus Dormibacterales bacterium]
MLTISALAAEPSLAHGFSTAAEGSVGLSSDDGGQAAAARARLVTALGLDLAKATLAGAVHGAEVARVDGPRGRVEGVDALVTDRPGMVLMAVFADCYPILLLDPRRPALAVAHAGWRGTRSGVVTAAVRALEGEYGCRPQELLVGIGPGICGRCYEVGQEVAAQFPPEVVRPSPGGRLLLDLEAANRAALASAGVLPGRVHSIGMCTYESPLLPSHRRRPDGSRFALAAALRPSP